MHRLITVENYADKYIPIKIHNAIIEALKETMPSKLLKRVKDYEEKVNKVIHATVLNDLGTTDLNSSKAKKYNKANLISQYSSIVSKRCKPLAHLQTQEMMRSPSIWTTPVLTKVLHIINFLSKAFYGIGGLLGL